MLNIPGSTFAQTVVPAVSDLATAFVEANAAKRADERRRQQEERARALTTADRTTAEAKKRARAVTLAGVLGIQGDFTDPEDVVAVSTRREVGAGHDIQRRQIEQAGVQHAASLAQQKTLADAKMAQDQAHWEAMPERTAQEIQAKNDAAIALEKLKLEGGMAQRAADQEARRAESEWKNQQGWNAIPFDEAPAPLARSGDPNMWLEVQKLRVARKQAEGKEGVAQTKEDAALRAKLDAVDLMKVRAWPPNHVPTGLEVVGQIPERAMTRDEKQALKDEIIRNHRVERMVGPDPTQQQPTPGRAQLSADDQARVSRLSPAYRSEFEAAMAKDPVQALKNLRRMP